MNTKLAAAIQRLDDNLVSYDHRVNCATEPGQYDPASATSDVETLLEAYKKTVEALEHCIAAIDSVKQSESGMSLNHAAEQARAALVG